MSRFSTIIKALNDKNIRAVLIGGFALRVYNSPRLTEDIDFAVRTLDIDDIVELMYNAGWILVNKVNNDNISASLNIKEAQNWISTEKQRQSFWKGYTEFHSNDYFTQDYAEFVTLTQLICSLAHGVRKGIDTTSRKQNLLKSISN